MITASQKKKENVAEYLLYMWHIEDLIRANSLDMDAMARNIIGRYAGLTQEQRRSMEEWYESLVDMMRREGVVESGHLQINNNVLRALSDLHNRLIKNPKYAAYRNQYYATLPYIVELRARAGENKPGELEACFTALYALMLLRMQGKEVSEGTLEAMGQISKYLATLSALYKQEQEGELKLEE